MAQYRITNAARADIVDILRLPQSQFGDQARQRYVAERLISDRAQRFNRP